MIDDLRQLDSMLKGAYGRPHEHYERISSTNDRALAWLGQGAPHGAVVTADAQDAGRGRRGRTWFSAPGRSLYVSLVLRPGPIASPQRLGALGLAVGVGLREGLPRLRAPVVLKWPNDLKIDGRKVGGILCEARWTGTAPEVVVGFGLNVHEQTFPPALQPVATTIAAHHGPGVPGRATVLAQLLTTLETTLERFIREGFASIRDRYVPYCEVLGRMVEVGDPEAPLDTRRGIAERIDDDGALWVRASDGSPPWRVDSSDVWLAPYGR